MPEDEERYKSGQQRYRTQGEFTAPADLGCELQKKKEAERCSLVVIKRTKNTCCRTMKDIEC